MSRHLSVFVSAADRMPDPAEEGFGFLLIGAFACVAFFSAAAELVAYLGYQIPHVLSMSVGLCLGIAIGVLVANSLRPEKSKDQQSDS